MYLIWIWESLHCCAIYEHNNTLLRFRKAIGRNYKIVVSMCLIQNYEICCCYKIKINFIQVDKDSYFVGNKHTVLEDTFLQDVLPCTGSYQKLIVLLQNCRCRWCMSRPNVYNSKYNFYPFVKVFFSVCVSYCKSEGRRLIIIYFS